MDLCENLRAYNIINNYFCEYIRVLMIRLCMWCISEQMKCARVIDNICTGLCAIMLLYVCSCVHKCEFM